MPEIPTKLPGGPASETDSIAVSRAELIDDAGAVEHESTVAKDQPEPLDLAGQVEALLAQVDRAVELVERTVREKPLNEPASEPGAEIAPGALIDDSGVDETPIADSDPDPAASLATSTDAETATDVASPPEADEAVDVDPSTESASVPVDAEALDDQLDALLSQSAAAAVSDASTDPSDHAGVSAPAPDPSGEESASESESQAESQADASPDASIDPQVDAMIADAERLSTQTATDTDTSAAADSPAVEIAAQESATDDAPDEPQPADTPTDHTTDPTTEPAADAPRADEPTSDKPVESLDDLDGELARLTESLLNGKETVPASAAAASTPLEHAAPTDERHTPAPAAAAIAVAAAVAGGAASASSPSSVSEVRSAPPPPPPEQLPAAAPVVAAAVSTIASHPTRPSFGGIRRAIAAVSSPFVKVAGALVAILAKPLQKQSKTVRDSVGWIALVTVFMGASMWGAVLMRDPASSYVPAADPIGLATDAHGGAHGAKESHGSGGKDGSHGQAKKPKSEGHGEAKKAESGGHGETATPPGKREFLIQRSNSKAAKAKEKEKPKSSDGH